MRVLLSNRRVRERSISVEGHAIVLAWLMLLGPAVVGPSAKHSTRAAVSYPCLAQRAAYPVPQVNHKAVILILRHRPLRLA